MRWPPVTSTHHLSSGQHGPEPESASRYFLFWSRPFPNTSWFDLSFLLGQQICKPQVSSISLKRKRGKENRFPEYYLPPNQSRPPGLAELQRLLDSSSGDLSPRRVWGNVGVIPCVPTGSPCQPERCCLAQLGGPGSQHPLTAPTHKLSPDANRGDTEVHCQGDGVTPNQLRSH